MLIEPKEFIQELIRKDIDYISVIHKLAEYHTHEHNPIYKIKTDKNEQAFIVGLNDNLYIAYKEEIEKIEEDFICSDFNSVLNLVSH